MIPLPMLMASATSFEEPTNCLKFYAESGSVTVTPASLTGDGYLEYSTNGKLWNVYSSGAILGRSVYFRGSGNTKISSGRWTLNGTRVHCDGNIETLLDYQTVANGGHPTMSDSAFSYFFFGQTNLVSAPQLSAISLSNSCYDNMFCACSALTSAPSVLPATSLGMGSYHSMFADCGSLTRAPTISANTISALSCYAMFSSCTSLTTIPYLRITNTEFGCCRSMFEGCSSLKISSTQTTECPYAYRIPVSGTITGAGMALEDMFTSTGGSFTGTPSLNTTYYTNSQPV